MSATQDRETAGGERVIDLRERATITMRSITKRYGGAGAPLAEYPTDWMKSETHYRPWWSLDAPNEDDVGFGAAKSATGIWYVVALAGAGDK